MWTSKSPANQKGMALALTLFFLLILVMGGSMFFIASQTEMKHGSSYNRKIESLSIAESAAERAIWKLQSESWATGWTTNFGSGQTSSSADATFIKIASNQYMHVTYPTTVFRGSDVNGNYANLKITATGMTGREENGRVIPTCKKQIEMIIRVGITVTPPKVWDYAYFINNWGWWYYGGGEQCLGSMRSNGRFDVKSVYSQPSRRVKIDGSVEAHSDVDYHNYSPDGLAGLRKNPPNYTEEPYRRPNLNKENIPNLQSTEYYEKIARGYDPYTNTNDHPVGMIKIGDRIFTKDGVFGDGIVDVNGDGQDDHDGTTESSHKNLILIGTQDIPIEIHNAVVVKGNLILKGFVRTYGATTAKPYASIYVGGNTYIADKVQYLDGPNWDTYPQWQTTSGTDYKNPANSVFNINNNDDGLPSKPMMDSWAGTGTGGNSAKSLLAVASRGGLIYGNYSSSSWISDRYLFNMGSEDVGADGIPDTNVFVDGHWTDPTEGDHIAQLATEDLDQDGSVRMDNYKWSDVSITGGNSKSPNPLNNFEGIRKNGDHGPLCDPSMNDAQINHYEDIATNAISAVDGIYYTQHFLAGRVANSPTFRGSIVSKDEAIVYSGTLKLIQDARCHSHYRNDPNSNFPIHLFPPGALLQSESATLGIFQGVINWREVR